MKSRDGKLQPAKNASTSLPGTIKANQVKSTIAAVNAAVARRGLKKKRGHSE